MSLEKSCNLDYSKNVKKTHTGYVLSFKDQRINLVITCHVL